MANLGKLTIAITATTKGLESAAKRTTSILSKLGSAATSLPGLLGIAGAGAATAGLVKTADAYTTMASQLTYMTGTAEGATEAQQALLEMSQKTGTSMTENSTALVRLGSASEMMGTTTEENVKIIGALNTLMLQTGTTGAQASSAMLQLTQALGSGKLAGDEFRSLMENSPALMRKFAESLGVGIGELKDMASEGKITTGVMVGALENMVSEADSSIGQQLPQTFERGWTMVVNSFQSAWDKISDDTGIMGMLYDALVNLSDWILANADTFSLWFVDLADNIRANWPEMKQSIVDLAKQIGGFFTNVITDGPKMNEVFKNMAFVIEATAVGIEKLIEGLTWILSNWDKVITFFDKMTMGMVSGTAAAAGTLAGGGSAGDAWNAYGDTSPFKESSGPKNPSDINVQNIFTQPVSRSDAANITAEQARNLRRG